MQIDADDEGVVVPPPAPAPAPSDTAREDTGTTSYGSADELTMGSGALLQTASAAGKWKAANKGKGGAAASGDAAMSPILSCILANCSVPYLTCLSSMECSAVFDCLQTTGAPIASCAKYHARMGERDKRMFGELSDCEQQHQCFGAAGVFTEPPTDAHTQPADGGVASAPAAPAPAPARPAKPVVPGPAPSAPKPPVAAPSKPRGPQKCEVVCARKCREDQSCLNACNASCFQKRYVVQL